MGGAVLLELIYDVTNTDLGPELDGTLEPFREYVFFVRCRITGATTDASLQDRHGHDRY